MAALSHMAMVLISRVTWAQSAVNMLSCEITAHTANVLDFSSCAVPYVNFMSCNIESLHCVIMYCNVGLVC